MSSQSSTEQPGSTGGMEWLENRRAALERFLCRTAKHPVLCIDPDFINFLQSDEELPKSVNTAALSGAGVMRLFNKVGETVNKITYKMDENDSVRVHGINYGFLHWRSNLGLVYSGSRIKLSKLKISIRTCKNYIPPLEL